MSSIWRTRARIQKHSYGPVWVRIVDIISQRRYEGLVTFVTISKRSRRNVIKVSMEFELKESRIICSFIAQIVNLKRTQKTDSVGIELGNPEVKANPSQRQGLSFK